MKIRNPNYKTSLELWIDDNKSKVDDFVKALPSDIEYISFEQVRLVFRDEEDLSDGAIEEIARRLNFEIER